MSTAGRMVDCSSIGSHLISAATAQDGRKGRRYVADADRTTTHSQVASAFAAPQSATRASRREPPLASWRARAVVGLPDDQHPAAERGPAEAAPCAVLPPPALRCLPPPTLGSLAALNGSPSTNARWSIGDLVDRRPLGLALVWGTCTCTASCRHSKHPPRSCMTSRRPAVHHQRPRIFDYLASLHAPLKILLIPRLRHVAWPCPPSCTSLVLLDHSPAAASRSSSPQPTVPSWTWPAAVDPTIWAGAPRQWLAFAATPSSSYARI